MSRRKKYFKIGLQHAALATHYTLTMLRSTKDPEEVDAFNNGILIGMKRNLQCPKKIESIY